MKRQTLADFLDTPAPWLRSEHPDADVALAMRIRLARNLVGTPFPGRADDSERMDAANRIKASLSDLPFAPQIWFDPMNLDDDEQMMTVERRFATAQLFGGRPATFFAITENADGGFMINEEDHLRLQIIGASLDVSIIWEQIRRWDEAALDVLPVAFSSRFGFLTSCPTNIGTGIRVSVMLHLPGIVLADQLEQILRGARKLGMAVRGIHGEGSDALGYLFQLSNQSTLGENENDIIGRVELITRQIIWAERNARLRLFQYDKVKVSDFIGRAYGILQHARRIDADEALSHLGAVRMGVTMNLISGVNTIDIDRMMLRIQPGHLRHEMKIDNSELRQAEDMRRADMIRDFINRSTVVP